MNLKKMWDADSIQILENQQGTFHLFHYHQFTSTVTHDNWRRSWYVSLIKDAPEAVRMGTEVTTERAVESQLTEAKRI